VKDRDGDLSMSGGSNGDSKKKNQCNGGRHHE
jgi:hypothetical protein